MFTLCSNQEIVFGYSEKVSKAVPEVEVDLRKWNGNIRTARTCLYNTLRNNKQTNMYGLREKEGRLFFRLKWAAL